MRRTRLIAAFADHAAQVDPFDALRFEVGQFAFRDVQRDRVGVADNHGRAIFAGDFYRGLQLAGDGFCSAFVVQNTSRETLASPIRCASAAATVFALVRLSTKNR